MSCRLGVIHREGESEMMSYSSSPLSLITSSPSQCLSSQFAFRAGQIGAFWESCHLIGRIRRTVLPCHQSVRRLREDKGQRGFVLPRTRADRSGGNHDARPQNGPILARDHVLDVAGGQGTNALRGWSSGASPCDRTETSNAGPRSS